MKKVPKKRFQLHKMNVSKLDKKVKNSILGGYSRFTVDLVTGNNC